MCIINNTIKAKDVKDMFAKYWKKIGMLIVIIACLFNIVTKLVAKIPYIDQLKQSAAYVSSQEEKNK